MNLLNNNPENKENNIEEKRFHTTPNHLNSNNEAQKNGVSFKTNENFKIQNKNKIDNSNEHFLQKSELSFPIKTIEKWSRNKIIKKIESKILNLYLFDDNDNEKNYLILNAKKENSNYKIFNDKKDLIALIKWNFLSSNFKVYDNNNKELLNVIYELNLKGLNGPSKMKIILNKDINNKLKDCYDSQNKIYNSDKVYLMENKQPVYNQIYKCYVLKFINRKIKTSTKNFQIVFQSNSNNDDNQNNILLQFAETEEGFFILDYKFPFNEVTAFAIGIVANSSKIFCEY